MVVATFGCTKFRKLDCRSLIVGSRSRSSVSGRLSSFTVDTVDRTSRPIDERCVDRKYER